MRVRVPASSANLGPGFDCFGIAWQLYNEIEFYHSPELIISGCPEKYQTKDNLAYLGYASVLKAAGLPEEPVGIRFASSDIPICRGLGSSSALIAGGVLAADKLCRLGLSKDELLHIAAAVEGHPDNIAPAILGGLAASIMDEQGRVVTVSFKLSDKLCFTALIPDFELSTELARSVLPGQVSRADAISNISRAALLLKALETGDAGLIPDALQDKLHEPYRLGLIPGVERVRELALSCGAAGMCISGAGSTLLCVSQSPGFTAGMTMAMAAEFPAWRVVPVVPDLDGAIVLE